MRTLIVGIGALGGTIATRALAAGMPLSLATRTKETARSLRASGLRVSGVGGTAAATSFQARALEEYQGDRFDLVLLATKAHEALEISPLLAALLAPGGTLLSIQNGGVSQLLFERLEATSFSEGSPTSAPPCWSRASTSSATPAICSSASWQAARATARIALPAFWVGRWKRA